MKQEVRVGHPPGEAIAAGIVGISIEVSSAIMLGTMSPTTI
jgi:hypothetical protein